MKFVGNCCVVEPVVSRKPNVQEFLNMQAASPATTFSLDKDVTDHDILDNYTPVLLIECYSTHIEEFDEQDKQIVKSEITAEDDLSEEPGLCLADAVSIQAYRSGSSQECWTYRYMAFGDFLASALPTKTPVSVLYKEGGEMKLSHINCPSKEERILVDLISRHATNITVPIFQVTPFAEVAATLFGELNTPIGGSNQDPRCVRCSGHHENEETC